MECSPIQIVNAPLAVVSAFIPNCPCIVTLTESSNELKHVLTSEYELENDFQRD